MNSVQLIYASSACADMRYLGQVMVPDPFMAFIVEGRSIAVLNQLEYARVCKCGRFDEVLLQEAIAEKAAAYFQKAVSAVRTIDLMVYLLSEYSTGSVCVPKDFPAGLAFELKAAGIDVSCATGAFFPQRVKKNEAELKALKAGNRASADGIRAAMAVLEEAKVKNGRLVHGGRALTSERLREVIEIACLKHDAVSESVIVAGGRQACDPHEVGHGPLSANELIIIDVFPQVRSTGYHGDLTRTVLKGRATDAQRQLVAAVRAAHSAAVKTLKAGISGAAVHAAAKDVFQEKGYATGRVDDHFEGFIHSTGHGLGLQVHEEPRVSPSGEVLPEGAVVTIEPGLYYPQLGAVRIEDVFRVGKEGAEKLSRLSYQWEIA